jgi:hypothetical protein
MFTIAFDSGTSAGALVTVVSLGLSLAFVCANKHTFDATRYVVPSWTYAEHDAAMEFAKESLGRNGCTGRLR